MNLKQNTAPFSSLLTASLTALLLISATAQAQTSPKNKSDLWVEKVVAQGVPEDAIKKLMAFRQDNLGKAFNQEVYTCLGKPEGSLRPCEEKKRIRSSKEVVLTDHPYAVIVDYRQSSMSERLFIIHLPTGKVTRMPVTHGKNSGALYAYKFSNIKDSKQSSLGIYILGETYSGGYGSTIRMYGLQGSNNQAYHRDIVMHGAFYAAPDFTQRLNPKTKLPFNRLGVSWGCPAVSMKNAKTWFPLLKDGALIYHYHAELEEAAQSGQEVVGPNLEALPSITAAQ